jgi:hypothetical protein
MSKTDGRYDAADYAPVADRITRFYERHPTGRIVTKLVSRVERSPEVFEVIFRARIYRSHDDVRAAASGYALEREDDGEINAVACVENTETSAIGRALGNLGFTASASRPSQEEMKDARARSRREQPRLTVYQPSASAKMRDAAPVRRSTACEDAVVDAIGLLEEAERAGFDPDRARRLCRRMRAARPSLASLERVERVLRRWLASELR